MNLNCTITVFGLELEVSYSVEGNEIDDWAIVGVGALSGSAVEDFQDFILCSSLCNHIREERIYQAIYAAEMDRRADRNAPD